MWMVLLFCVLQIRHNPGVKRLTRRSCPLLNCECSVGNRGGRSAPPAAVVRLKEAKTKSCPAAIEVATCMTRNGVIATCFVCVLIAGTDRAHGLDPSKRLTQYRHNVSRVQDGFFPGARLESGVSVVYEPFQGVCRTVFREYDTKNHADHQRLHLRGNRIRTPWV